MIFAVSFSDVTALLNVVVWPVVVLGALLAYRREIPRLIGSLSSRVSKLSVAGASVEFARASEAAPAQVSAVTEFIDATSASGIASDAAYSLNAALQIRGADFVKIDLGVGRSWMTSRLFIFSLILAETARVKRLVFIQRDAKGAATFSGLAEPLMVADRLGHRFRWLQYALTDAAQPAPLSSPDGVDQVLRLLADPQRAAQVAGAFLGHGLIRDPPMFFPPGAPAAPVDRATPQFVYAEAGDPSGTQPPAPPVAAQPQAAFVHALPMVTSVTPSAGPSNGGTEVTIRGSGFTGTRLVRFGDAPAFIKSISANEMQVVSPPGAGHAPVTVITPTGSSTTNDDWVILGPRGGQSYREHAEWIRDGEHLLSLVGDVVKRTRITQTAATRRAELREMLLRQRGEYAVVVDDDGQFLRLVDRYAVLDGLAGE